MSVKIKICGMKYPDNINQLAALEPDFMGFIFWEKSKRFLDGFLPEISEKIQKVGVFVDQNIDFINLKVQQYQLDFIQLHGAEHPTYCAQLKENNHKIIKAFSVDAQFDFTVLNDYASVCDYFLFDTKGKLPGGNGVAFDWDLLHDYTLNIPFFLSGGIGIQEINAILEMKLPHLYAIDFNSKLEIEPGLKNIEGCKKAIDTLRIGTN